MTNISSDEQMQPPDPITPEDEALRDAPDVDIPADDNVEDIEDDEVEVDDSQIEDGFKEEGVE